MYSTHLSGLVQLQDMAQSVAVEDSPMTSSRKNNTVTVSDQGDLILQIDDGSTAKSICYRVSSAILRRASGYFDVLLDPNKFSEGIVTSMAAAKLEKEYPDISLVPASSLPKVQVSDVGQFPIGMSNKHVLTHFFKILHDPQYHSLNIATPLVTALLAVVADRFDAVAPMATFVNANKRIMKAVLKSREEIFSGKVSEEVIRQNILSGLLLRIDDLVLHWSARLIIDGSSRWVLENEMLEPGSEPQWWNLPDGVEGKSSPFLYAKAF